jgi:hypothetical protein
MDRTGEHHAERGSEEDQKSYVLPHMWTLANTTRELNFDHMIRREHTGRYEDR